MKLSIKHYLNTNSKGKKLEGETVYPVYLQIIFNQETTRLKVANKSGKGVFLSEKMNDPDKLVNVLKGLSNKIYYDENILSKIIFFEYDLLKEGFTLKGFGDRIYHYDRPISQSVQIHAITPMKRILADLLTYNQYRFMEANFKAYDLPKNYLHAKSLIGDFRSHLDERQKDQICSALLFKLFDYEKRDSNRQSQKVWIWIEDVNGLSASDWIQDNLKLKFTEFLKNLSTETLEKCPLKLNEMFSDFPFEKDKIYTYSGIVESAAFLFLLTPSYWLNPL